MGFDRLCRFRTTDRLMEQRENFETWLAGHAKDHRDPHPDFSRDPEDASAYVDRFTQTQWEFWKGALDWLDLLRSDDGTSGRR